MPSNHSLLLRLGLALAALASVDAMMATSSSTTICCGGMYCDWSGCYEWCKKSYRISCAHWYKPVDSRQRVWRDFGDQAYKNLNDLILSGTKSLPIVPFANQSTQLDGWMTRKLEEKVTRNNQTSITVADLHSIVSFEVLDENDQRSIYTLTPEDYPAQIKHLCGTVVSVPKWTLWTSPDRLEEIPQSRVEEDAIQWRRTADGGIAIRANEEEEEEVRRSGDGMRMPNSRSEETAPLLES